MVNKQKKRVTRKRTSAKGGAAEQSQDSGIYQMPAGYEPEADEGPGAIPGQEVIILGFRFPANESNESGRLMRCGSLRIDEEQASLRRELLGAVLSAARFLKHDVPDLFTPFAAELFYREGRLEEVRMKGSIAIGADADANTVFLFTSSRTAPAFTTTTGGLAGEIIMSESDRGRSHLAFYRKDDSLVVSWDLGDQETGERRPEAIYHAFEIAPASDRGAPRWRKVDRTYLARREEELKGKSVEEMRNLLRLPAPVEVSEPRVIQMSDLFRKLIYVYEREDARCQLADYYARNADLSEYSIKKVARDDSISVEEARAQVMFEHEQLRDEFIEKNIDNFFDWSVKILQDVFDAYLTGEVNSILLADGSVPRMDLNQTAVEIHEGVRKDLNEITRKRLGLAGRGRTPGTSPKRGAEKTRARMISNKRRIEEAISKLLQAEMNGNEGKKTLGEAMAGLTTDKVIEELEISYSTLNRWIKQSWTGFTDAKIKIGTRLRVKN